MTFSHPDWINYKGIETPQPLIWKTCDVDNTVEDCFIGTHMLAWLMRRPHYCDRGHFSVDSSLQGLMAMTGFHVII